MTNTNAAIDLIIQLDARERDNSDDFDLYDMLETRKAELSAEDFERWCDAFEICPVHEQDWFICRDDDLGCNVHGCNCPTPEKCAEAGEL